MRILDLFTPHEENRFYRQGGYGNIKNKYFILDDAGEPVTVEDFDSKLHMLSLDNFSIDELEERALRLLIIAGIDRNVIVFDIDGKTGDLNARLVSLMKVIARRNSENGKGKLETIISPKSIPYSLYGLSPNNVVLDRKEYSILREYYSQDHEYSILARGKIDSVIGVVNSQNLIWLRNGNKSQLIISNNKSVLLGMY